MGVGEGGIRLNNGDFFWWSEEASYSTTASSAKNFESERLAIGESFEMVDARLLE